MARRKKLADRHLGASALWWKTRKKRLRSLAGRRRAVKPGEQEKYLALALALVQRRSPARSGSNCALRRRRAPQRPQLSPTRNVPALMSLPTPSLQDHNPRHLDRFKKLEQLRQHFWTRWSSEYVSELQQRVKWRTRQRDLQLGELVLIKDEALQPLHWRMGRVVKLHPGTDGVPRVADIATARGPIRRALNRICPLRDEEEVPES
ncbi:uncharacterized protein [Choristoneura fumiferana]|uniref:uncharacterized protein n=1 Tax=Choristoneura fumiferana TaxID=7141 RepID=UPI003D1578E9